MHSELVKIILAYAVTAVFVFTALITCLSLIGVVRFAESSQQKTLFKILIVEIVVVVTGFFSSYLEFNPNEAKSKIVKEALLEKQRMFKEKLFNARAAFEKKDFQRAYALTDALLKSDEIKEYMPVIDLFALNGDISSARNFWTEAVESYGPALKVEPENVGLLVRTGNAQRQLKNYEMAEKLYDRAISNQSQNWEALDGYYNCLRRYAAFLSDNHPKIADIKFSKGAELADQMLIVSTNEGQKQQSMLAKAKLYWEWKKYEVARATYLEAIRVYPDVQRYREDIAALLVEMGHFQEGRDAYAALYEVSKDKASAAFIGSGYAEAAAKAKSTAAELEKALSAGLLSISKKPDDPFAYYAVAMVYRSMHRGPDSLKYLRDAEAKEASRDVNIHTYDRTRHLMYKALLKEWS